MVNQHVILNSMLAVQASGNDPSSNIPRTHIGGLPHPQAERRTRSAGALVVLTDTSFSVDTVTWLRDRQVLLPGGADLTCRRFSSRIRHERF
jgi:hypothetical protein